MKQIIGEITKENIKALLGELIETHYNGLNHAMSKADDGKLQISMSVKIEFQAEGICDLEAGISYSIEKVKDRIEKHVNENQMDLPLADADKVYRMGGQN